MNRLTKILLVSFLFLFIIGGLVYFGVETNNLNRIYACKDCLEFEDFGDTGVKVPQIFVSSSGKIYDQDIKDGQDKLVAKARILEVTPFKSKEKEDNNFGIVLDLRLVDEDRNIAYSILKNLYTQEKISEYYLNNEENMPESINVDIVDTSILDSADFNLEESFANHSKFRIVPYTKSSFQVVYQKTTEYADNNDISDQIVLDYIRYLEFVNDYYENNSPTIQVKKSNLIVEESEQPLFLLY